MHQLGRLLVKILLSIVCVVFENDGVFTLMSFIEKLKQVDFGNEELIATAHKFESDNGPIVCAEDIITDYSRIRAILLELNSMDAVGWCYYADWDDSNEYPDQFYDDKRDYGALHPVLIHSCADANIWLESVADASQHAFFFYLKQVLGISEEEVKGFLIHADRPEKERFVTLFWETQEGLISLDSFNINIEKNTWELVLFNQEDELEAHGVMVGSPLIFGNVYSKYVLPRGRDGEIHRPPELIDEYDGWHGNWSYDKGHDDCGWE